MVFVKCHECGRLYNFPEEVEEAVCPGCGLVSRAEDIRRISSLSGLLERLREWPLLPDDLRADLAVRVAESLEETLSEARERVSERDVPVAEEVTEEPPTALKPPSSPERTSARVPVRLTPTVWSRLGPVFAENSLFVLAAFLIVAGAVFFVTTAWTTMSGSEKLLVVVGGIVVLGGILFTAGKVLNRGGTLSEVEEVLVAVTAFLLPVAAVPAGLLLASEPVLGAATAGILLALGFFAVREMTRMTRPELRSGLPVVVTVLAGVTIAAAHSGTMPATAGWLLVTAFLVVGEISFRRTLPRCGDRPLSLLWPCILLAFALLAAAGAVVLDAVREGTALRTALPALGMAASAFGVALVLAEGRLVATPEREGRRFPVLLVIALALGVTGTAIAIGNERALLWAAGLGAAAAIVAALRLPVPGLLVIGLALSAVAYLKIAAPFREAAMRVRDSAARELGYQPKALPLAYYGITFLPFVAACGLAAAWLHRLGRAAHANVTRWFTIASSAGLALMALTLMNGDYRAPAAVLSAQGALLIVLSPFVRDRWFAFGGMLALFAGLACGLQHLAADRGVCVAALAGLGLVSVLVAARLLRGAEGLRREILLAVIGAAAAVTSLLTVAVLMDYLAGVADSTWRIAVPGIDIGAYVLLAVLVGLLASAYRFPAAGLFACLLLAPAVESTLLACGLDPRSGWRVVFFAAASALPILAAPALRFAASRLHRPRLEEEVDPAALLFVGTLALQALGFPGIPKLWLDSWPEAGGLLAGAAVLTLAAIRFRRPWMVYIAVAQLAIAGPTVFAASNHREWGGREILAFAVSLALTVAGAALSRRHRVTEPLALPLVRAEAVLGAVLLCWGAGLLVFANSWSMPAPEGFRIAAGAFLAAIALRLGYRSAAPRAPVAAPALGLLAGLLPAVAAIGTVVGFDGRSDLYPLALIAAAAVPVAWAGRSRLLRVPAAAPALLALVLAYLHGISGTGRPWVLLPAFLALAAGGWAAAKERRIEGSLFALVALLGAISLAVLRGILDVPDSWQPLVLLLFAAAVLHAPRLRLLRVHRVSALAVGGLILAAGAFSLLYLYVHVISREPWVEEVTRFLGLTEIVLSALAFVIGGVSASLLLRGAGRWLIAFAAALLAVAAVAPVNLLLEGSFGRFPRPDVETALLAAGLAALAHRNREGRRHVEVCQYATAAELVAAFALVLTFAEVGHVSTPLTVFAATLAPLILFLRRRAPVHGELHAHGLLVTAVVVVLYLLHGRSGNPQDAFPLLGAAVAAVLAGSAPVAGRLRRSSAIWLSNAGLRFGRVVATGGVFIALCVAIGSVDAGGRPASVVVCCAVFGSLTAVLAALHSAAVLERPKMAHVAVLNVLAVSLYLANRTELLSFLDGYHFHALTVLGAGIYFLGSSWPKLSRVLTRDGLLVPVPAVIVFVASAIGGGKYGGPASSGLFLAAAVYGAAAYRRGSLGLGGLSVVLVNLALFAFWRSRGILDPAFYGVPAGLSLLASGEVLRGKIQEDSRKALFALGAVALYGSVGVQVLRVEEPTHALVLFALGILTVVYAFTFRRPQLQVLGTVVVVMDVLAYLLRHGFEESFLGAALLVSAGITVLVVAGLSARRRRAREDTGR